MDIYTSPGKFNNVHLKYGIYDCECDYGFFSLKHQYIIVG